MEGIETLALFEEKIAITPRDLANQKINIHATILSKLAEKMEGKCSLHGWVVPDSLKVLSRSMGYLEKGRFTGDIVFHVQVQAKVLNPPSGSHLTCQVVGNNMMGMYVSYKVKMTQMDKKTKAPVTTDVDAIKIILPRDLHLGDEAFSKVEIGDTVHVEVKKSRFQVNDKFILSVGVFEGKVGSGYVAPQIEEKNVEEIDEEGPTGKYAMQAAEKFEEELKAKEAAKKAEALALIESMPPLESIPAPVPAPAPAPTNNLIIESQPTTAATTTEPTIKTLYFNMNTLPTLKELDNRFPAKFTLDGKEWPSVEHYYQAMQFPTLPEFQEEIRKAATPAAAVKLAKDPTKPVRPDWKEQREEIMNTAIRAKFRENPAMQQVLLKTYPNDLVFADGNDSFWGYGRTKMGQNKVGKLLMKYRNENTGMEAVDG
jgi:ribA/ribD-fused uncharacterized protein